MAKAVHVPITPEVLDWAIKESGYTVDEVAAKAHIPPGELRAWLRDQSKPTLTQTKNIARALKRTPSTFLLPHAPLPTMLPAQFRHAPGSHRSKPTFEERRYLREARRVQEAAKWLARELSESRPSIPRYTLDSNVEHVGQSIRQKLRRLLPTPPSSWQTHAQALHAWRAALEASGVLVFVFPLGEDSARGFSIWDDDVPLIAINSAWNHAARVYTLFHEYGHLLTRTSSVCVDRSGPTLARPTDSTERWCEEFAAATLLPWSGVAEILAKRLKWSPGDEVQTLSGPRAIANAFKVSLRAATIRLIERDAATWGLYSAIPLYTDRKRKGGSGDGGRDRGEVRRDQYGQRTLRLFFRALDRQLLGRGELLDYLDVPDAALDRLQGIRD